MKKMHMVKYFFLILAFLNFEDSTAQVVGTPYMPTSILPPNSPPIVSSPITGRLWMAYNLDATRVATSSNDASSFGGLFQWGRKLDGHQKTNSTATSIKLQSVDEVNSNFISLGSTQGSFYRYNPFESTAVDFRNQAAMPNLWQPANGVVNNPCPNGFRIPTVAEFEADIPSTINTVTKAFNHFLIIPRTNQYRHPDGSIVQMNLNEFMCYFWTSTLLWSLDPISGLFGYRPRVLGISQTSSFTTFEATSQMNSGFNIRCIKGLGGEN